MKITYFSDITHGRDNNLNLVRMIAASSVLISHAFPIALGEGATEPLQVVLRGHSLGNLAVLVFFAVSGFLIAKSYDRKQDWKLFLSARCWRIYPALAAVLALTVLFGFFFTTAPRQEYLVSGASYFVSNLSLARLQYPLPGIFEANPYGPAINGSLWTLVYEVICYLGILALGLLGLLRSRLLWVVIVLTGLALVTANAFWPLPVRIANMVLLGAPFIIGSLIYAWRDRIPASFGIAAILLASAALARDSVLFDALLSVALAYSVLLVGFVRMPILNHYNRLGDYSYGTYIFAFPIQQIVASYGVTSPYLLIAVALPLTLLLAVISWHFLESRCLAFAHRQGARPTKAVKQA